jgi:N-acetylglutamate synthase-like GNAT family acetyltransferase
MEEAGNPIACMALTFEENRVYLGKLATHPDWRRRGLAALLVDRALRRAKDRGLPAVELQTRVELAENHAAFRAMGFEEVGRTAHPGYTRPTSITFRRAVADP